ncbi:BRF1-domain-containing protein [Hysterangium stoloniferum]|nr:BRF1-domain-containing protein [Hysterangium stoloniferum]
MWQRSGPRSFVDGVVDGRLFEDRFGVCLATQRKLSRLGANVGAFWPVCGDCGGTTIEYDAAAGNAFCIQCGTVVEENTIVAEISFGETSNGAAMVQGSYVGQGHTRARVNRPGGFNGSGESREQTLANARRKIRQVQAALHISDHTGDQAQRWYTLAVEHRFTKGRRNELVVAVCLYVACRMSNTSHMLIDFSDMLQVNVFVLGMTYLRLVQTLNIKLPLIDPAHYIHRFAALLEFGDETGKVATDAVRLVQRFNRDWMTAGRRPAGICGACLLLAARMNNFRRSVQEVVQVVKIADVTLKKRLEEFKKTSSGNLTVADFRKVWLEEEEDPPAFTQGKEKERKKLKGNVKKENKKKRKRKRDENEDSNEDDAEGEEDIDVVDPSKYPPVDLSLFNEGILADIQDTSQPPELFLPDSDDGPKTDDKFDDKTDDASAIDPRLLNMSTSTPRPLSGPSKLRKSSLPRLPTPSPLDESLDSFLAEEVSEFIENEQGSLLADALDTAEQRRQSGETVDELLGLDEDELDRMILGEEEVKLKERIWVELNRDYLENLAAKAIREQHGESSSQKPRKRRKTGQGNKPRDASSASGSTTAESVRNLVTKNKKFSRKINYSAYDSLFGGTTDTGQDKDADDDGLYHMEDKSDGEAMVLVEEEGGGVGMGPRKAGLRKTAPSRADVGTAKLYSDDEQDAEGEKDDDTWGAVDDTDPYEQEV